MPFKVPTIHITLHRNGKPKRFSPADGPVEFSQKEVDEILSVHKGALRDPVNERPRQAADTQDIDPNTLKELDDQQKDAKNQADAEGQDEDNEI